MLSLTMMNDNDIALKFTATILILFVFGRMIVLLIHIRPNTRDPIFDTALTESEKIQTAIKNVTKNDK